MDYCIEIKKLTADNLPNYITWENFLTEDYKYLCLSYTIFDYFDQDSYNDLLDSLNRLFNIYDKTEELYFETDYINKLPSNILNFKNLKRITISGSRFWSLSMDQIPTSVKYINVLNQSNLQTEFFNSCDNFNCLEELYIVAEPFYLNILNVNDHDEPANIYPIPKLNNIKYIGIQYGSWCFDWKFLDNWKEILRNHILMSNNKDNIKEIIFDDCDMMIIITFI